STVRSAAAWPRASASRCSSASCTTRPTSPRQRRSPSTSFPAPPTCRRSRSSTSRRRRRTVRAGSRAWPRDPRRPRRQRWCVPSSTRSLPTATRSTRSPSGRRRSQRRSRGGDMGWIDVHHHFLPPRFVAGQRDEILDLARNPAVLDWTPARAIEQLDRFEIDTAYISLGVPGAPELALARVCNEYAADLTRDHPGRFGVFASLPLPNVKASLAELEYAFD